MNNANDGEGDLRDRSNTGTYWDRLRNECSLAFEGLPESLPPCAELLAACAVVEAIEGLTTAVREQRQTPAP